ncbi:MAG: 30S ribosome-binding factor RbfA [Actinomycetota bacterium]|nr:30S ribosome-binding factor RbfA [Actinomycetota bacterium]
MPKRGNPRAEQRVKEAVAELLEEDIADPRVSYVTVTDVRLTEDHKRATVYYTTLEPGVLSRDPRGGGDAVLPDADEAAAGLASAAPRVQGLLARRVRLRNTPILEFAPDEVVAEGRRIDDLLRRVGGEQDEGGDDDGD